MAIAQNCQFKNRQYFGACTQRDVIYNYVICTHVCVYVCPCISHFGTIISSNYRKFDKFNIDDVFDVDDDLMFLSLFYTSVA